MSTVLVIFGVLLLGCCRAQEAGGIFNEDMGLPQSLCAECSYCVAQALCINGKINEFGDNMLGPRSVACNPPDVCCRLDSVDSKCTEQVQSEPMIKNTPNCGTRVPSFNQRSALPEAEFGEFPWLLQLRGITENSYYGGASLIHPQIALTAAHTVVHLAANELMVHAGVWSMNSAPNSHPPETRSVSEKVLHERFDPRRLRNDIALLFLSSPFRLRDHINTVCLPPPNAQIDLVTCYGTGWGKNIRSSSFADKPKKISMPTLTRDTCQRYLRDTALTNIFKLHESFMCAGGEADIDVCFGDGGSPLVCPVTGMKNKMYQIGIVSWGLNCGDKDVPGVYANLPYLRMWVDEKVIGRGHDPTFYVSNIQ